MGMKKTIRILSDMATAHHMNIIQPLRVHCPDMTPANPVESYRGGYLVIDHTVVIENRL